MDAAEKREFSRVNLRATASLDLPDGTTAVGDVLDLSMKGIAVRSALQPELDTEGQVAIVFGDGPEPLVIRGHGKVVRSSPQSFAIELDELELDSYHHLQMLVVYNGDAPSQIQEEIDNHVGLRKR